MSFFDQRTTLLKKYSMAAIRTSDPEYSFQFDVSFTARTFICHYSSTSVGESDGTAVRNSSSGEGSVSERVIERLPSRPPGVAGR